LNNRVNCWDAKDGQSRPSTPISSQAARTVDVVARKVHRLVDEDDRSDKSTSSARHPNGTAVGGDIVGAPSKGGDHVRGVQPARGVRRRYRRVHRGRRPAHRRRFDVLEKLRRGEIHGNDPSRFFLCNFAGLKGGLVERSASENRVNCGKAKAKATLIRSQAAHVTTSVARGAEGSEARGTAKAMTPPRVPGISTRDREMVRHSAVREMYRDTGQRKPESASKQRARTDVCHPCYEPHQTATRKRDRS
jgi:hypothetical protein